MSKLIVKDNALINASYNLNLTEQRLILLAILEARESGRGINANEPLFIHAENYINQFSVQKHTAYEGLRDAALALFSRQFSYQQITKRGHIENVRSRWVSQISYIDHDATVSLIFAPAIVPLITRLEAQFTKYDIEQVSALTSAYAVRLFELLICWRSAGATPIITLEDFRSKMGVLDGEYLRIAHLKERVIDFSLAQINEKTDLKVKYEQHKKGRTIVGFSFTFKTKAKPAKAAPIEHRDPDTPDLFNKMTEKQISSFSTRLAEQPSLSDLAEIGASSADFAAHLASVLRDPESVKPATVARINSALSDLGFKN